MTEEQKNADYIRRIAKEVSEETIRSCLTKLGIDHSNPTEMQKDMSTMRDWRIVYTSKDYSADMQYLNRWRVAISALTSKLTMIVMGLIIAGAVSIFWGGFKDSLRSDDDSKQQQQQKKQQQHEHRYESQYKPPITYKQPSELTVEELALRTYPVYTKDNFGTKTIK